MLTDQAVEKIIAEVDLPLIYDSDHLRDSLNYAIAYYSRLIHLT